MLFYFTHLTHYRKFSFFSKRIYYFFIFFKYWIICSTFIPNSLMSNELVANKNKRFYFFSAYFTKISKDSSWNY